MLTNTGVLYFILWELNLYCEITLLQRTKQDKIPNLHDFLIASGKAVFTFIGIIFVDIFRFFTYLLHLTYRHKEF